MKTGIYSIEHVDSGRVYIGSAIDFGARWRVHLCLLRAGAHHSPHLQASWSKYGEQAFKFGRMLVCAKDDLLLYEQILIDGTRACDRRYGFNARPNASSNIGVKASEETREKIRSARAKQVFSPETRALWSKNRTGRKMPEWFGDFTRSHRTGAKHSQKSKDKISAAQLGTTQSLQQVERRAGRSLETIKTIFDEYAKGGVSQVALAGKYGVDPSAISLIVRGKRWGKYLNRQEK